MTHTHKCLDSFFTITLNAIFAHTLYSFPKKKENRRKNTLKRKQRKLCAHSANFGETNLSVQKKTFVLHIHSLIHSLTLFHSLSLSLDERVSVFVCDISVLVLPIKRLNRNGDIKNNNDDDHSGKSCLYYIFIFGSSASPFFDSCPILYFIHSLCWVLVALPVGILLSCHFNLSKSWKCPLDAWLRQPDFMPGTDFCLADYIQQRQTKQAHSRKVSDLKQMQKIRMDWAAAVFFVLLKFTLKQCCMSEQVSYSTLSIFFFCSIR